MPIDADSLKDALQEMDRVLAALSRAEADDLYRKAEAFRAEILADLQK